jgi:hypothetical protein
VLGALALACALCGVSAASRASTALDKVSIPRRARRGLTVALAIAVLAPAMVLGPTLVSRVWHSFTVPGVTARPDPAARLLTLSGTRYQVWKVALKAFERHPATGTGAGTFTFWWDRHATDSESLHDAHDIWLQNLAELGAPGLLLIVAVAACALATALAASRRAGRPVTTGASAACLAVFTVYLWHASVDWMWEATAVTVLMLAGVATVSVRLAAAGPALGRAARSAVVALALIGAAVQVPSLLSTVEIRRSQAAMSRGDAALALGWADDAIGAEPWSASAYDQRALVLEALGRLAPAARDLRSAVAREPTNYVHWLLLSRVQTERDLLAAAAHDYERAHALRPRSGAFAGG